jgi:hypothetical protein
VITEPDREFDARILVSLMGWRWMRVVHENLCRIVPPEPWTNGRWEPCKIPIDLTGFWEPCKEVPPATERYRRWWIGANNIQVGKHAWRNNLPSPSTSPEDCADLRAELAKDHHLKIEYGIGCELFDDHGIMVFIDGRGHFEPYSLHDSPVSAECMAVARAAEKLIEQRKESHA